MLNFTIERDIINPSILSNLVRNGFGTVGVLYEML